MPRPFLHLAFGSALILFTPLAAALGFGPTRNHTTLGQHLDFAASVLLESEDSVSRDCVSAGVLAGDNPVAARHVRTVLETTRDPGRRVVRVTTSVGIDEPVATIDIAIGCGSRVARRFVAFIDPPSLRLAEAAAPSETAPLPNSRIDSQVVSLTDVARQADASWRPRDREPRAQDVERQPQPRRTARPPAPLTVASALEMVTPRPRRPADDAQHSPPRIRIALAAPPRTAGARLQLDPPRAIAVVSRSSTPTALLAAPAAVAMAASAPPTSAATTPRPATDPLLAQVNAAAAAAAGGGAPTGSFEQQRIKLLEDELARMRADSEKTRDTLATLQSRMRQAEQGRYRNVLVYVLAATTLLGILVATALWLLRPRQRRRARWFDAQANQQARAAARGAPSTSAGLASQPAPLSRPAVLAPQILKPPTSPAELRPASNIVSPSTGFSTASGSLTTQSSSIGGLEVTTVLGPEVSRSSFGAFGDGGAARQRSAGELTMEELIDLEQQAEFFVVLGQDEAAMSLLEGYIDGTGKSPLPYLQLLEIHQRRDDRDAYDNIRDSFNERFNANAPDWSVNLHRGRSLEDYPQTVALLQSLWTTPLSAMQELDRLLFRREETEETFDFPAYRELLFLYSVAREISENVETDLGSIDLFLPLDDPPGEAHHSQIGVLEATRPFRGSFEVDLDVSRWPEDAAMSDLLGRTTPSGQPGAA